MTTIPTITRIIAEIPELQRLEGQVIESEACVTEWKNAVKKITSEIKALRVF